MVVVVTLNSLDRLSCVRPDRANSIIFRRNSSGYGGLGFGILESSPNSRVDSTKGDQLHSEIVALYGKRFTIEETFRDQKNLRFGMGLSETRIGDPARRDRLLLISALAVVLLTILGAAGEAIGIDKWLKTNTVKHRTISLVRQGLMHYAALPKMKLERFEPLMVKFGEMLRAQRVFREVFGLI